MIDACSDPVPISGCGGRACSSAIERFERASTRPMRRIASRPSAGRLPCAARPRVSTSTQANPLCADADLQVGRLGHDGGVGAPARARARRRRCSRTPRRRRRRRSAAGRQSARCATTRAASIIAATPPFMSCAPRPYSRPSRSTGSNGASMPVDADGVDVAAEHQRAPGARVPRARRSTFGPARCDVLRFDVEADARACASAIASRDLALHPARRARASGSPSRWRRDRAAAR